MAAKDSTARERKSDRQRARYHANNTVENRKRLAARSLAHYHATKDSVTPEQRAKKAEYKKAWGEANKERLKIKKAAYAKVYYAENLEKTKAYRDANKDKILAYGKTYYIANKERMNAEAAARYRADPESYKARARKWERDNVERKSELRAQYRAGNREKIKDISRADWRKHNAKRKAAKVAYRAKFPELGAHHCRLRQTRKQKATPAWADLTAIKAKYKEAARLRKETGSEWHVDHEIPLKHPLVSGLHVHANLRVIPGPDNQSKGNGFTI